MKRHIKVLSSKVSDEYLAKGEAFLKKNQPKYRRALQYFYQALYFSPIKTALHYVKIAEAYFYLEENDISTKFAKMALRIDTDCLRAYELLRSNSDNDEEVIEYCQHMVRLKPDYGYAYLMWSEALKRQGNIEEARKKLYQTLKSVQFLSAIKELAKIEYHLGNEEVAIQLFTNYIKGLGKGFRKESSAMAFARFYLDIGQILEAIRIFEQIIEESSRKKSFYYSAHFYLATIFEQQQKFLDAINHYKVVIGDPKYFRVEAYLGLRRCYISLGKTNEQENLEQLMTKRFSKKITEKFDRVSLS